MRTYSEFLAECQRLRLDPRQTWALAGLSKQLWHYYRRGARRVRNGATQCLRMRTRNMLALALKV
jgi:hypothetical protein